MLDTFHSTPSLFTTSTQVPPATGLKGQGPFIPGSTIHEQPTSAIHEQPTSTIHEQPTSTIPTFAIPTSTIPSTMNTNN